MKMGQIKRHRPRNTRTQVFVLDPIGHGSKSAEVIFFALSSRRPHTRCGRDWSSDVCSSDLTPKKGDKIVVLGGDNYRIGMGGASVSSAHTEDFGSEVEINAIQRNNAEMQMRVANTIRTDRKSVV